MGFLRNKKIIQKKSLFGKDLEKERNFVLDLVTFIFDSGTASKKSWREYF